MNAKVELKTPTPAEQAVAKAAAEHVITDGKGRSIKLKRPGVLAQFRLIEALGDTSKNEVYMNMVLPLIFVVEIDGDAVFQPNTKREVEALIQRLDEEGVAAVVSGVQEHFGASNPEADKQTLKN
jgi:LDH2 family malate/lactate/ureidoglycolate dehydrogenase